MFRRGLWVVILLLAGCQSIQEKNLELVNDRVAKLKAYGSWSPTWCRVETRLTQPALARYREMFPDEAEKLNQDTWAYTWKSRKSGCEVTSLEPSEVTKNHQAFLDAALCTLLEVHWVNSPFADLSFSSGDLENQDDKVQIRAKNEPTLGIYLDSKAFTLQTRTKNFGVLSATYVARGDGWVPETLQQTKGNTVLRVEGLEFGEGRLNGRPLLSGFWISVGEGTALRHTHVALSECRNY